MGQTLPHGVYLPDNGERNCYTGLSQNWQKLDNLIGSHGDTVSFSQTLTEGVEIGKITINGVDVSLYHTDYSGKANDSEVVHTSGNETIGGIKSFSNDIRISKASPFCNVFSSGYIKGQAPTSNIYSGVRFFDDINSGSANTITGGFEIEYNRDGYNKSYISSRNYAGETHKFFTVGLRVPNDDTRSIDFLPSVNGIVNLGTSSYKWAKVYSDDVVHTSGDETISDEKTFASIVSTSIFSPQMTLKNDSSYIAYLQWSVVDNCNRMVVFDVTNSEYGEYLFKKTGLLPSSINDMNLGTSTNKWKTINGINPGALSLPNISNTGANAWIALDTTNWVKAPSASAGQKYTPLADGWLNVRVDNATMLAIAVGGNYMHQMVRSETLNSLALLMPVFKNEQVTIMVGGNENLAYSRVTFYYCQGNV